MKPAPCQTPRCGVANMLPYRASLHPSMVLSGVGSPDIGNPLCPTRAIGAGPPSMRLETLRQQRRNGIRRHGESDVRADSQSRWWHPRSFRSERQREIMAHDRVPLVSLSRPLVRHHGLAGRSDQNTSHQLGLFLARGFIDALGRLRMRVLACRKGLHGLQRLSHSR